jgi:hypothetical protein
MRDASVQWSRLQRNCAIESVEAIKALVDPTSFVGAREFIGVNRRPLRRFASIYRIPAPPTNVEHRRAGLMEFRLS